jgi:hypothetical protein
LKALGVLWAPHVFVDETFAASRAKRQEASRRRDKEHCCTEPPGRSTGEAKVIARGAKVISL